MGVVAVPLAAQSVDAARGRQAAAQVAGVFRRARQEAIARSANVAVVFDQPAGVWSYSLCADGNGNGVRRADITKGKDPCFEGPTPLSAAIAGATIATDAALPAPDGGPGSADPVQFGSSNLASFSAAGTATSGTVFVRTAGGVQYAVRVAGTTARTRILRYDTGSHAWIEP